MDSVVKMKSLPFDATQLDIIQFFETFKLKPNGVQLVVRSDNKPTGEAFVDFESHEEAGRAMREKDHKVFHEKFGDRYVRLIQVRRQRPAPGSPCAAAPLVFAASYALHLTRRAPIHTAACTVAQQHAQRGLGLLPLHHTCTAAPLHNALPPLLPPAPRCPARRCRPPCPCALAARAS
jgi:hypothetical protein